MRPHQGVQLRLRERRLVRLVVPVATEADHVHEHVFLELGAILRRQPRGPHNRLRIIAIHMQHRRVDDLRDVRAVFRRAAVFWIGGEPDEIVDHNMQRAAHCISREFLHVQTFRHHALPRQRGIAVDRQRGDLLESLFNPTHH